MKIKVLLLFLCFFYLHSQEKEKILFIGNSFTFYWNLPIQTEKMGLERGLLWEIHQSTAGGATLKDHWIGNKGLKTKNIISTTQFDRIVFQEQSTMPIHFMDSTYSYFKALKTLISEKTQLYFYATWTYPNVLFEKFPSSLNPIHSQLEKYLATEPIQIVPVGKAFDLFKKKYPEIHLLTDDFKHPNPAGSYLAACVFYVTFSGQSSKGLSRRYSGKDEEGKSIYYSIVEAHVAAACQQIADEVVFGNASD